MCYRGELWTDCQAVDGIPRCAVRGQRSLKKCAVAANPKSTALPALLAAGSVRTLNHALHLRNVNRKVGNVVDGAVWWRLWRAPHVGQIRILHVAAQRCRKPIFTLLNTGGNCRSFMAGWGVKSNDVWGRRGQGPSCTSRLKDIGAARVRFRELETGTSASFSPLLKSGRILHPRSVPKGRFVCTLWSSKTETGITSVPATSGAGPTRRPHTLSSLHRRV